MGNKPSSRPINYDLLKLFSVILVGISWTSEELLQSSHTSCTQGSAVCLHWKKTEEKGYEKGTVLLYHFIINTHSWPTYIILSKIMLTSTMLIFDFVAMGAEDQLCCPATSNQILSFHELSCQSKSVTAVILSGPPKKRSPGLSTASVHGPPAI